MTYGDEEGNTSVFLHNSQPTIIPLELYLVMIGLKQIVESQESEE